MHATLGIDVSKLTLDVCLALDGVKPLSKRFDNDFKTFETIIDWVSSHTKDSFCVAMEVTSEYHLKIATFMHGKGFKVSLINPFNMRSYMRSLGNRNKTDKIDAKSIALFAQRHELPAWNPPTKEVLILQERFRAIEDLKKTRQAFLNRLEHDFVDTVARRTIMTVIDTLANEIKTLKKELQNHIKASPALKKNFELLDSIPGVAQKTATLILSEVPDITRFESSKQFAAFIGITPKQWQSGTSIKGTVGITRVGNGTLRKGLFFPAMSAKRIDDHMKHHFEALVARNKRPKVALIATMHQLARIVYGVLKSQKPFDPEILKAHHDRSIPKLDEKRNKSNLSLKSRPIPKPDSPVTKPEVHSETYKSEPLEKPVSARKSRGSKKGA